MTVQIAHDGTGYRCYSTSNGIERHYIGPRWDSPRRAAEYADLIERTTVSPLRESTEPSTAAGVASPPPVGQVEGSVDVPRGPSTGHTAGER